MTDFKLRPVHIASRALPPSSSPPYANPPQRGNHSKVSNYILFFVLTVLFQIARAHGTAHWRGAHNTKPHPTANGGTTTTTTNEERQGNHDGKGEPRGGGPGRTTRPTTESGARYAPGNPDERGRPYQGGPTRRWGRGGGGG